MTTKTKTRDRLLDAAETLFAQRGLEGASMRSITTLASANLAAVNYHFGSKEGLLRALLEARVTPINEQRLARLDRLEERAELSVEAVLEAFIRPALDPDLRPNDAFLQIMTRIHHSTDPVAVEVIQQAFGPVAERYIATLHQLLPAIPPAILMQRMQFLIGAMLHSLFSKSATNCPASSTFPDPEALELDDETYLREFVGFCAAGLRHG